MNHDAVHNAVHSLGSGPLTEEGLRAHIFPLFSRVLTRDEIYLANHSLGRPLDCMADDVREALVEIQAAVRERRHVRAAWGLRGAAGISVLLSGHPGVGKTMTAGWLAKQLDTETKK